MALDWCPFAIRRPITGENYTVGRGGQRVRAVVVHIAAGPLSAVFPTFNDPTRKASAHFCVGKDGTIEQYVSVNDTAYANGLAWKDNQWHNPRGKPVKPTWQDLSPPVNPNLYTLSIEHEGYPADPWTPAMYDANNRLLLWLAEQFDLTYVPHRTLIGHLEIDPLDKADCPGPHVEYERMARDVTALVAAKKLAWMPINTDGALYKFAQAHALGYPQTDEFAFAFEQGVYLAQVFNGGIVYAPKGDWANTRWIEKPRPSARGFFDWLARLGIGARRTPAAAPREEGTMQFDPRLTDLGISVTENPGGTWDLRVAKYQDPNESGGKHHIFFTVLDATGKPNAGVTCVVDWVGREPGDVPTVVVTDAQGEANVPIFANLNTTLKNGPYFAYVESESKSDVVRGMGLPEKHHVNFLLTFGAATSSVTPQPPPSGTIEDAVIAAAKQHVWMPINTDAALYKFAQAKNLGYPQTDEFEFPVGAETYIGQVFNLGIVYVKKGDWGNVRWVNKPTS